MKLTIQTEDKSENHITLHLEINGIFIAVTEDAEIVAGGFIWALILNRKEQQ